MMESQPDKKKLAGSLSLLMAFALAGTSVISARVVSQALGVFTIASVSLLIAFLFLLPACTGKWMHHLRLLSLRTWIFLLLQALFGIFLFRFFLLNGIRRTSAMEAGILTGATPAITAIIAILFLRETVSVTLILGIATTVGGIMTVQGLFDPGGTFSSGHVIGNLLVLCAAASESTFNVISRACFSKTNQEDRHELPALIQTELVIGMAFLLCLFPALWESPLHRLSDAGWVAWLSLFWYGVFVTALAFIFWYSGIKRCGALSAAAFSGMMPLTSMLLSITVLGETAGWQQWIGGFAILAGMVLVSVSRQSTRKKAVFSKIPYRSEALEKGSDPEWVTDALFRRRS